MMTSFDNGSVIGKVQPTSSFEVGHKDAGAAENQHVNSYPHSWGLCLAITMSACRAYFSG